MKLKSLIAHTLLFASSASFSQAPDIAWQLSLGGNETDWFFNNQMLRPTSDGGVIIGSASASLVSGNKTEASLSTDYWIVKLNASGIIEWQKTAGGDVIDNLHSVQETNDGGCIVGGSSSSGISGNKTESGFGGTDMWILKLDASGTIEWQKTIGGTGNDGATDVQQTPDGGYLIVGSSNSPVSGNKTVPNAGGEDIWILKLDGSGNIIWQSTLGGSVSEYPTSFCLTSDGGFIVGGNSDSPVSGNKSEGNYGLMDLWIVKMDADGNIEWQNTIGGSSSENTGEIIQTPQGDYFIAAHSNSNISFDKTENSKGNYDYWLLKLDGSGNIIWQNTIGGNKEDKCFGVDQTLDGGLIVCGYSFSGVSGDKTEAGYGGFVKVDYWLVKTDSAGGFEWDKSYGGNGADYGICVKQLDDESYMMAGYSNSGISGNKTQSPLGFYDVWLIRLSDDFCIPSPEICNATDDDCNGIIDDVTETVVISADGPVTFCQGGSVTLNSVYSGISVRWKRNGVNIPGAESSTYIVSKPGSYTCETSSPCDTEISNTILVNVNKNPSANITADGSTTFCAGGSVTLNVNPIGGSTYQWYKGAVALAGATNTSYITTLPGNYKCRVTKTATGCFKNSNTIIVTVPCKQGETTTHHSLPIAIGITTHSFTLHPNPTTDKITITIDPLTTAHSPLTIMDVSGRTIEQHFITSSTTELDVSTYAAGIYFIHIKIDGETLVNKLIVE